MLCEGMQDKEEVQHNISLLLFVALACGVAMLLFTRLLGSRMLTSKPFNCLIEN